MTNKNIFYTGLNRLMKLIVKEYIFRHTNKYPSLHTHTHTYTNTHCMGTDSLGGPLTRKSKTRSVTDLEDLFIQELSYDLRDVSPSKNRLVQREII